MELNKFANYKALVSLRSALCLAGFLACFPSSAEPDMAYAVLTATSINETKQPTWICFERHGTCVHIALDKKIVALEPGKYRFGHIDFGRSKHSDRRSQVFYSRPNLNLEPGLIYFVGDFQLKKRRLREYDIELKQPLSLLTEACKSSPETFEKYPVTNLTGSRKRKFSCGE